MSDQPNLKYTAAKVVAALSRHRIPLTGERDTQAKISILLTLEGIEHEREVHLDGAGIIDFLFPGGLGMEVKMHGGGSAKAIHRQLLRYAEHERITSLILASNKAMGVPNTIAGKPARFFSLGRSWL